MAVKIKVRHEDVGSTPPIKNTYDFLSMVLSVGERSNTGFNSIAAKDVSNYLNKESQNNTKPEKPIWLSKKDYEMIVYDISQINFLKLRLGGIMIANYLSDILEAGKPEEKKKQEQKEGGAKC